MRAKITHWALQVSDLERSIAFYERFCGLKVVHDHGAGAGRSVWMAEPGRESAFVIVILAGGSVRPELPGDMTHYGFAVASRADVDAVAEAGRAANCLHWEPQDFPPPVGYLCALKDPDGYVIEFSYGQPLGPGAAEDDAS